MRGVHGCRSEMSCKYAGEMDIDLRPYKQANLPNKAAPTGRPSPTRQWLWNIDSKPYLNVLEARICYRWSCICAQNLRTLSQPIETSNPPHIEESQQRGAPDSHGKSPVLKQGRGCQTLVLQRSSNLAATRD